MIGYWLVQALQNAQVGRPVACLVSRTLVSAEDPAFSRPTKFVGPVYAAAAGPRAGRARAAGRSARTARPGAGWCRRRSPSSYLTSR